MMGVKVYMFILLVGVINLWANASDVPVSPHVPYAMSPSRTGRQTVEIQPLQAEGGGISPGDHQVPDVTPEEDGHQLQPGQEHEMSGADLQVVPSGEDTLVSNEVPQTTEQVPLLTDDMQMFLEEKQKLLEKIKLLEEANRHLRLAERQKFDKYTNITNFIEVEEKEPIDTLSSISSLDGKGLITTRPVDCADHLVLGATRSGIYDIYPFTCLCTKPVQVYCDMETDGGGWTVFLTRQDLGRAPVNFNRTWSEYKLGFGDIGGEYWLGNEILHTMTFSREYTFRMDLQVGSNDFRSSLWKSLAVDNEVNRYKLTLGTYSTESTTYSNCFPNLSGRFFSTFDRDYDSWGSNCAYSYGGFWHHACGSMYPTGIYATGLGSACYTQKTIKATFVQLKIRPSICGSTFKTVYLNSYDCDSCH